MFTPRCALVLSCVRIRLGGHFCKSSFNRTMRCQLDGRDSGQWPLACWTSTPKCFRLWAEGGRRKLAGPFLGLGSPELSPLLCAAPRAPVPELLQTAPEGFLRPPCV